MTTIDTHERDLPQPPAVADAVRAYFLDPSRIDGEDVTVLGVDAVEPDLVIVIFRRAPGDREFGIAVGVDRFARLFAPAPSAGALARIIASDEIFDQGVHDDCAPARWTDRLSSDPERTLWRSI